MLSYTELQSAYVDLYIQLRKYIWDFNTVEHIADLEIEVYRIFPSISDVSNAFNKLDSDIKFIASDDDDFKSKLDAFRDILNTEVDNNASDFYAKLNQVREVIQ